jgi:hypothetical protein
MRLWTGPANRLRYEVALQPEDAPERAVNPVSELQDQLDRWQGVSRLPAPSLAALPGLLRGCVSVRQLHV